MPWTEQQHRWIELCQGRPLQQAIQDLPEELHRWKCWVCHIVLHQEDLQEGACPVCGRADGLHLMCPLDHCHCHHEIIETIAYCPICRAAICPRCGSHDVVQISRVTGYLAEVHGWNTGKQQELKDRVRINLDSTVQQEVAVE